MSVPYRTVLLAVGCESITWESELGEGSKKQLSSRMRYLWFMDHNEWWNAQNHFV